MRTLLIDNYDSYTFNLFHLLGEVNGEEPLVVRNDAATWEELRALEFDNVVISPGPGRPQHIRDVGVSLAVLEHSTVPVLGVCLGHQALAHVMGGVVDYAPEVMHGRLSPVHHDGIGLFADLPNPFTAVRYHSLVVRDVPPELKVSARTADGVVMALEHCERPLWGVQFHPESVCTADGRLLIENFHSLTIAHAADARRIHRRRRSRDKDAVAQAVPQPPSADVTVLHRRLGSWSEPEHVFGAHFASLDHVAWLDSARVEPGLARFSFIATPQGPLGRLLHYDADCRSLRVERKDGETQHLPESVLDYCARELKRLHADGPKLPFDFIGGFVGYLGYELRCECGAESARSGPLPDAGLLFCDRVIAFDHSERRIHLLALADANGLASAQQWLSLMAETINDLADQPESGGDMASDSMVEDRPEIVFTLRDNHDAYLDHIAACHQAIHEGESYEVCLTTELVSATVIDPVDAYGALRIANPAPHAALLRLGELSVLSSSPEGFLRIDRDGVVESKPIKGTAPRGLDADQDAHLARVLQGDEKSRAENLMIADLVRNDIGRVCELGSVHVPELMVVESYATVHQLVSRVRGRLREGLNAVDAVRACFPAGSMTGAPKLRTMEIIDTLEDRPRGIYSGALGYLSVNATADLSVVIRTIVATAEQTSIGSGGAILAASDPESEFSEMLLKAQPMLAALGATVKNSSALPLATS